MGAAGPLGYRFGNVEMKHSIILLVAVLVVILSAIVEDIRRMERESGRQYVNFPQRRADGDAQITPPTPAAT